MSVAVITLFCVVSCKNNNAKQAEEVQQQEPQVVTAESIYSSSIDKVALVIAYKDEIPISQGTAFFIEPRKAITNYHVIDGCDRVELKFSNSDDLIKQVFISKGSYEYDLAVLESQKEFPFFVVDSLNTEGIGSKIYTIGNPRGLEGTISEGIISGKRLSEGVEYIQITAPISPGNSGGPLLNGHGSVIAVSSFTFKNSQNLNFAIPIKYISECTDYISMKSKTGTIITNPLANAIEIFDMEKSYEDSYYTFSVKNNTADFIKKIDVVFICKNTKGQIIDYSVRTLNEAIAPKMAKRFHISGVFSADYLMVNSRGSTASYYGHYGSGQHRPERIAIETIVLNYEIDID